MKKNHSILIAIDTLGSGGAQTQALYLLEYLSRYKTNNINLLLFIIRNVFALLILTSIDIYMIVYILISIAACVLLVVN